MTHSVKRHLDVDSRAYDVEIRRFIPHYDDMLATGVELLARLAPPDAHVLDLGGGTGALSAGVLRGVAAGPVTPPAPARAVVGASRRRSPPGRGSGRAGRGHFLRAAARGRCRGGLAGVAPRA